MNLYQEYSKYIEEVTNFIIELEEYPIEPATFQAITSDKLKRARGAAELAKRLTGDASLDPKYNLLIGRLKTTIAEARAINASLYSSYEANQRSWEVTEGERETKLKLEEDLLYILNGGGKL